MAVNTVYPTGYVDVRCFRRVNSELFIYHSPIRHREYELNLINGQWACNCLDKRHNNTKCCKHEQALLRLWERHQERGKSLSMCQAEEAAARATRDAEMQEQINALHAEIEALRGQLVAIQSQPAQIAPDMAAIIDEINALKAENAQFKRELATKATKRKKHQSELESAALKETINLAASEFERSQKSAARAAKMLTDSLAELEAIPGALKEKLDKLSANQTISDLEALEEELKAEAELKASAADRQAEEAFLAQFLKGSEEGEESHETTQEERAKMPLNGNHGFSLLK